jgi:hypothetical protein
VTHPAPKPWLRPITGSPWLSSLLVGIAALLGAAACGAGTLVEFPTSRNSRPRCGDFWHGRTPVCRRCSAALPTIPDRPRGYRTARLQRLLQPLSASSRSARLVGICGSYCGQPRPAWHCPHWGGGFFPDQAFDAYAARLPVATGFCRRSADGSHRPVDGGFLSALRRRSCLAAQYFNERFRAAIARYPGCAIPAASMTAPTLVLIGEADDWNSAERCRQMVAHSRPARRLP